MGGKVLDLDIIRAHDAGLEEGREEAMDTLDIPKSERSKYMTML